MWIMPSKLPGRESADDRVVRLLAGTRSDSKNRDRGKKLDFLRIPDLIVNVGIAKIAIAHGR
jgi:hypothetical protein